MKDWTRFMNRSKSWANRLGAARTTATSCISRSPWRRSAPTSSPTGGRPAPIHRSNTGSGWKMTPPTRFSSTVGRRWRRCSYARCLTHQRRGPRSPDGPLAARRPSLQARWRGQPVAAGEKALSPDGELSDEAWRVLIHDFRNLLAVIINYSELIAEETGDAEAVKTDIGEDEYAPGRAIAMTEKLRRPRQTTPAATVSCT